MRLILVRHGNTFDPGTVPYCVGATEDLPLVEKGLKQAAQFGQALKDAGVTPAAWYSGPLARHRQFSEIAIEVLCKAAVAPAAPAQAQAPPESITPIIDERLNELNYGDWSGLTDQEIKEKFGAQVHEDWSQRCIWPSSAGWLPPLEQVQGEIASFLNDMLLKHGTVSGANDNKARTDSTIVAVTSGGRLRYFLQAIPDEFERRCNRNDIKISTGRMCVFNYTDNRWSLVCWNVSEVGALI